MTKDIFHTDLGLRLVVLALVEEPLKFLAFKFLSFSQPASSQAPLLILNNEHRSPLVAVTQYLTGLLASNSDRLILLFRRAGFMSLDDWEKHNKSDIRYLRRLVMLALSWVQRRQVDRLTEFPFSLCCLVDPECSIDKKDRLATAFQTESESTVNLTVTLTAT